MLSWTSFQIEFPRDPFPQSSSQCPCKLDANAGAPRGPMQIRIPLGQAGEKHGLQRAPILAFCGRHSLVACMHLGFQHFSMLLKLVVDCLPGRHHRIGNGASIGWTPLRYCQASPQDVISGEMFMHTTYLHINMRSKINDGVLLVAAFCQQHGILPGLS